MSGGIAIIGYASLDHAAMLDSVPRPGRTSTILARPANAWPRLGGSPAYVAGALAAAGVTDARPVSWIGADEAGDAYLAQLRDKGVLVDAMARVPDARTPMAVLAYDPDGGCCCLYDPGMPKHLALTPQQRAVIADADWLCVTIGPTRATLDALEALSPTARLAWVVKDDPRALTPDLAAKLAGRADLICHSRAERGFVEAAFRAAPASRPERIVIETLGGEGATVSRGGTSLSVVTIPFETPDPTGAGDTFAGGVIAALAAGETDLQAVVEAGHHAAAALLRSRLVSTDESA
ncbi:carbohydrate kinase family protein [Aquibium carbonis]|uniref:Carbohydrate kinase family protein n=1 Tax=Aquibium carbonis TaxID=2495581 RepID=A0A3R9ZSM1_9HYPH|nr:PfkB family carbohydrate kinase [Aquibium carbonis]RST86741.1 carbohydrate kinase family protein [Aquibium carbonis]